LRINGATVWKKVKELLRLDNALPYGPPDRGNSRFHTELLKNTATMARRGLEAYAQPVGDAFGGEAVGH